MNAVLIVDDDPQILSLANRYLTHAGFDVAISDDFLQAMFQLRAHRPSVLIVDVRLGDRNGLQLAIIARQQWPDVPIVTISGWDDPVLKREAAACQTVFLTKPFGQSQLVTAIQHARQLTSSPVVMSDHANLAISERRKINRRQRPPDRRKVTRRTRRSQLPGRRKNDLE
jgi:DNA-binding response OmpR family regulator